MLAPKFPLNFSVWYLVISQKVCSNDTRAVDQTHRMTVSAWYLGSESIMAGRQRSFTLLCMYTALSKGDISSIPELGRSPGEGIGYLLQYSWASLVAQKVKNPPAKRVDLGSIPELVRSPGGGHGNPLQYSCLENPHGLKSLGGCSPWGCKTPLSD